MQGPAALSSRRGRRSYVLTVLAGLMLPVMLLMAFSLALAGRYLMAGIAVLVATVHFRGVTIIPTLSIEVDGVGVSSSHLFGSQRVAWVDVTALTVVPTGFSANNVVLRTATGKYWLMISVVDNHRELGAAIVQHAVAANPAIQVRGTAFLEV